MTATPLEDAVPLPLDGQVHNVMPHGSPPRGLLSTPSSQLFQGRFGRMFRLLPPGRYGATEQASRAALMTLGEKMTSTLDPPKDGADAEESGIPALYTYFGQFVDHDITFDPVSTLTRHGDPDGLTDFRTPALDLDNVYGRGPNDQPYLYNNGPKFLLGDALLNGAPDLPRNNADPQRALIGDPRNDENSVVSQFQALFLRFHNRMVDENHSLNFQEIQRLVRFHYQYVILNDFLPRIINADVLEDLTTDGQYDRGKLKFFHWRHRPFMPVEFSVAAYRLGHSMIRPGYRLNDNILLPIFPVPDKGLPEGLTGFRAMNPFWGIDWGRFIDLDTRSDGTDNPDDEATHRRLQFAYRIDTSLVEPLAGLPPSVAGDPPPSLAQRNLLRGLELDLPTGQAVARAMGVHPLSDSEIIIGKAVDAPGDGDVLGSIDEVEGLEPFRENCPLWTYILAEAAHHKLEVPLPVTEVKSNQTPQLGPVGGRIVAEVFLGMLFGDNDSLLNLDPNWTPDDPGFELKDLVAFALGG
ncbi:MAG TPA: heme peroxidase family protein [Pseudonocardia sp.]